MTYQSTNLFPQPTPSCGPSCEKVTGSNVINVLKGGLKVRFLFSLFVKNEYLMNFRLKVLPKRFKM